MPWHLTSYSLRPCEFIPFFFFYLCSVSLSKLQEIVKVRNAWCVAVHGVVTSRTWLSDWTTSVYWDFWREAGPTVCGHQWRLPGVSVLLLTYHGVLISLSSVVESGSHKHIHRITCFIHIYIYMYIYACVYIYIYSGLVSKNYMLYRFISTYIYGAPTIWQGSVLNWGGWVAEANRHLYLGELIFLMAVRDGQ